MRLATEAAENRAYLEFFVQGEGEKKKEEEKERERDMSQR